MRSGAGFDDTGLTQPVDGNRQAAVRLNRSSWTTGGNMPPVWVRVHDPGDE
jgi:hypothetical protein